MSDGRTHWEGCWRDHHDCAVAEVERLLGIEQLAQMWAVYQDDDSKREQQADPWLRQMAETCEENLYNAVAETRLQSPTDGSR